MTLTNWLSGTDVVYEGQGYGFKNCEFERFADLRQRTARPCVVAMGGPAPRERLKEQGWLLENPLTVTGTIAAYQEFIGRAAMEFGVAKHAYVVSRAGGSVIAAPATWRRTTSTALGHRVE
jgi:hypothetical protein